MYPGLMTRRDGGGDGAEGVIVVHGKAGHWKDTVRPVVCAMGRERLDFAVEDSERRAESQTEHCRLFL